MKKSHAIALALCALLPASCGYHLGGTVRADMEGMKTYSVSMFENHTVYPNVAMQVTSAIGNALQGDGAFEVAPASAADFTVSGTVKSVELERKLVDWRDSYLSLEVGVYVIVDYTVTDNRSGKVLSSGELRGEGSYFNTGGNTQTGRDAALSYASRQAAESLVETLTIP